MFFINLVFVDDKTIRKLNRQYRRIDKATSVLSFDYGSAAMADRQANGTNCLGEILICLSEARKRKLSLEKLVNHGLKSFLPEISTAENHRVGLDRD